MWLFPQKIRHGRVGTALQQPVCSLPSSTEAWPHHNLHHQSPNLLRLLFGSLASALQHTGVVPQMVVRSGFAVIMVEVASTPSSTVPFFSSATISISVPAITSLNACKRCWVLHRLVGYPVWQPYLVFHQSRQYGCNFPRIIVARIDGSVRHGSNRNQWYACFVCFFAYINQCTFIHGADGNGIIIFGNKGFNVRQLFSVSIRIQYFINFTPASSHCGNPEQITP